MITLICVYIMEEWRMELEHEIVCDLIVARTMMILHPNKDSKEYIIRLEDKLKRYQTLHSDIKSATETQKINE